jgi:acyl-homoserine-lactone acylase
MLPYEQLPSIVDPPTGWLQNANDPPWTSSWPLVFNPDSFAPYVAPREMSFRPQQSAMMQLADSSITFDELVAAKHNSHMALADRLLPDLTAAVNGSKDGDARRALEVLAKWDRAATAESRGAALFTEFVERYYRATKGKVFARPWRLDSALTTPAGLADPKAAVAALADAARETEKAHGALDVAWGDVVRIKYRGRDLPGNGASGDPYGVFRVIFARPDSGGKRVILGGDTYYQVVEFSDPVRAKVLTAYGNATQPGSKHVGDQLELFAKQQMRDAWRTRADVERNLEARETVP